MRSAAIAEECAVCGNDDGVSAVRLTHRVLEGPLQRHVQIAHLHRQAEVDQAGDAVALDAAGDDVSIWLAQPLANRSKTP